MQQLPVNTDFWWQFLYVNNSIMKQNQEDGPGNLNSSDKEHKQLVDTEH